MVVLESLPQDSTRTAERPAHISLAYVLVTALAVELSRGSVLSECSLGAPPSLSWRPGSRRPLLPPSTPSPPAVPSAAVWSTGANPPGSGGFLIGDGRHYWCQPASLAVVTLQHSTGVPEIGIVPTGAGCHRIPRGPSHSEPELLKFRSQVRKLLLREYNHRAVVTADAVASLHQSQGATKIRHSPLSSPYL